METRVPATLIAVLALVLALPRPLSAQTRAVPVTEEAINRRIDELKAYLLKGQRPDGSWPDAEGNQYDAAFVGGQTALVVYALATAGMPVNSPELVKARAWLNEWEPIGVYNAAFRALAFAKSQQLDPAGKYKARIERDVQVLLNAQHPQNGDWGYLRREWIGKKYFKGKGVTGTDEQGMAAVTGDEVDPSDTYYDNSNTQIATLALYSAAQVGVEVPRTVWERIAKHWNEEQKPDGGFAYSPKLRPNPYGSMSAAGLASLFIVHDMLSTGRCCQKQDYDRINKALDWMAKNYEADKHPGLDDQWMPYYHYSVERAGVASGYRFFGDKDWFMTMAKAMLSRPIPDGDKLMGAYSDAAFQLIALCTANGPVAVNKLDYGPGFHVNPRDCANVARYLARQLERPVNWEIVNLKVDPELWHTSPVLLITGQQFPAFDEAAKAKLKAFVESGGTILADGAGAAGPWVPKATAFFSDLFDSEFRKLDAAHPVFTAARPVRNTMGLQGLSNGCRELVLVSQDKLACPWQRYAFTQNKDAFDIMLNLWVYSTDKSGFRSKAARRSDLPRKPSSGGTPIAQVKHGGVWNPCPAALPLLGQALAGAGQPGLDVRPGLSFAELAADPAIPLAYLTGLREVLLSEADAAGLQQFLARGGTLLAASAMGDPKFAASVKALVAAAAPGGTWEGLTAEHAIFKSGFPMPARLELTRTAALQRPGGPIAEAYVVNGRPVALLCPLDLTNALALNQAWGAVGYATDSATAIAANLVLAARTGASTPPAAPASAPAASQP